MRCWSAVSRLVASIVLIAYSLLVQFVAASGLRQPTHINRVFRRDRGVVDAPSFHVCFLSSLLQPGELSIVEFRSSRYCHHKNRLVIARIRRVCGTRRKLVMMVN